MNEFDKQNYAVVNVYLQLRRRAVFYIYYYIVPGLFLSILSMVGFLIPKEDPVVLELEVAIFLANIFFADAVSKIVPASSIAVPPISVFFRKRNLNFFV